MGRPEIFRSGEVSLGDNPAGNEVDDKENQSTDTIGPVPEENREGHQGDHDPDKPVEKFAERFPVGHEPSAGSDENEDDENEDDENEDDENEGDENEGDQSRTT